MENHYDSRKIINKDHWSINTFEFLQNEQNIDTRSSSLCICNADTYEMSSWNQLEEFHYKIIPVGFRMTFYKNNCKSSSQNKLAFVRLMFGYLIDVGL